MIVSIIILYYIMKHEELLRTSLFVHMCTHVNSSDIALSLVLRPKVLLLDEPVAGMGPEERTQMIDTVYSLWKKGGLTIVLIEHDMDVVFRIAQHIYVLSYGQLLAQGSAEQIQNNPDVIEAYLGTPKELAHERHA